MEQKEVIVVGCGIAGLETALRLERKGKKVTVIEPREELLFYPSSHKALTHGKIEDTTINLEDKFSSRNIKHVKKEVEEIKPEEKQIQTENKTIGFEKLVIALGAQNNYYNIKKQGKTYSLRNRKDLENIKKQLDTDKQQKVVIVGGGATGVETAAAATQNQNTKVTILEAQNRILTRNTEKLAKTGKKHLEKQGVQIKTNTPVETIKKGKVKTEDSEYPSDITIYAGGIQKHSLIEKTEELAQNPKGIKVNQKQKVENFEDIYAVGDCATYKEKQTRAFYALIEAKTAAKNITGKNKKRKIPFDPIILYLGPGKSAFQVKNLVYTGRIPSLMAKIGVEKRYMIIRENLL